MSFLHRPRCPWHSFIVALAHKPLKSWNRSVTLYCQSNKIRTDSDQPQEGTCVNSTCSFILWEILFVPKPLEIPLLINQVVPCRTVPTHFNAPVRSYVILHTCLSNLMSTIQTFHVGLGLVLPFLHLQEALEDPSSPGVSILLSWICTCTHAPELPSLGRDVNIPLGSVYHLKWMKLSENLLSLYSTNTSTTKEVHFPFRRGCIAIWHLDAKPMCDLLTV